MHLRGDLCNYMYVGFFQGELGEPGSDGKDGDRGSLVSYQLLLCAQILISK